MRIFTRYIWTEILSHAFLGGALFTFVLFIKNIGQLLEMAVRNSSSLGGVIQIFLFTLPNTFTVTIPMAVLVGVLLGLSRLAADSEITAMRACGVGVWTFVRIVSIVSAGAWAVCLVNSLYLAPMATRGLLQLEDSLKNQQASFEVQPRVFYEDFTNYVLYVQNVLASSGAAQWRHVFLADLSDPADPKVTTAEQASVYSNGDQSVILRLRNGTEHELINGGANGGASGSAENGTRTNGGGKNGAGAADNGQYQISTFAESEIPLRIGSQTDERIGHSDTPILAMTNRELWQRARAPHGRIYQLEIHRRFAYPAACLVLTLVGIPLGMFSRRGGKSAGFVLTIALVVIYYFISQTGVTLARQGKVPVFAGVWTANLLFAAGGLLLLRELAVGGWFAAQYAAIASRFKNVQFGAKKKPDAAPKARGRGRFPLILDDYVLREFVTTFTMVLVSFVVLMLVFTFFDLLGDIIRNRTPLITVGEYLTDLTPNMIYNFTPLAGLVGVLVTFGILSRTNELTAMKATGISLYRVMVPIVAIAAALAVGLFLFDESYLPAANRREDALRSVIKGKPAQTFLRPDRHWIFGKQEAGKPGRIFYYEFFDPDRDRFANLTVFEFNPENFSISRRLFAESVHWEPSLHEWIFEQGWERRFDGEAVSSYSQFSVETAPDIDETPQYFKKEARLSQEMSYGELRHYIRDLGQSGFDTKRLNVQLNVKLAYPLVTLVMAVLAVPFALSMGKRGSLTGIAAAIGLAIAYWVVKSIFEALGDVNMLPALLAAWTPDLLFGLAGGYLLLRTPT